MRYTMTYQLHRYQLLLYWPIFGFLVANLILSISSNHKQLYILKSRNVVASFNAKGPGEIPVLGWKFQELKFRLSLGMICEYSLEETMIVFRKGVIHGWPVLRESHLSRTLKTRCRFGKIVDSFLNKSAFIPAKWKGIIITYKTCFPVHYT